MGFDDGWGPAIPCRTAFCQYQEISDSLPRTRTKFGEQSFSYAGPAAWNTLPHYVHEI